MTETRDQAKIYLEKLKRVMDTFDLARFDDLLDELIRAYEQEKTIFVMGNGGSGSIASHFACDINKGCCMDLKKRFRMICLNDNLPTMLAYANDVSYTVVFEEQLKNLFHHGDLVIGISGSGNSENVLRAIQYAQEFGGRTIGMSGYSGGKLAGIVDVPLVVPIQDMQKVEDMFMIAVHMIMQIVYGILHPGQSAVSC
jgi:D-sedoheptulose 7-phosphate isomerase